MEADIAKNVIIRQKNAEWATVLWVYLSVEALRMSGEGANSYREQLAQELWLYLIKNQEKISTIKPIETTVLMRVVVETPLGELVIL